MPKKKESVWTMGNKGPTGPWLWQVWVKGTKKPLRMIAFDLQHIKDQLEGKTFVKAKQVPEEKEDRRPMHLGPKGCVVNQPADYDKGFRVLRAWIDSVGDHRKRYGNNSVNCG